MSFAAVPRLIFRLDILSLSTCQISAHQSCRRVVRLLANTVCSNSGPNLVVGLPIHLKC